MSGASFWKPLSRGGFDPKIVKIAETGTGQQAKREFFARLKRAKAEGAIFKDETAGYVGGEAGRSCWSKHKFQPRHPASWTK